MTQRLTVSIIKRVEEEKKWETKNDKKNSWTEEKCQL